MQEDEEEGGRGDGTRREEARSRDDARERKRERGVGGAVGRQSVEVTGLWSRRDAVNVGGEENGDGGERRCRGVSN